MHIQSRGWGNLGVWAATWGQREGELELKGKVSSGEGERPLERKLGGQNEPGGGGCLCLYEKKRV